MQPLHGVLFFLYAKSCLLNTIAGSSSCSTPANPEDGSWFCQIFKSPPTCHLECDPGFAPTGRTSTQCNMTSGSWSTSPLKMTCSPAVALITGGLLAATTVEVYGPNIHARLPDLPDTRVGHTLNYVDSFILACGGSTMTGPPVNPPPPSRNTCIQMSDDLTWKYHPNLMQYNRDIAASAVNLGQLSILGGTDFPTKKETKSPVWNHDWTEGNIEKTKYTCAVKISAEEFMATGGAYHPTSSVTYNVISGKKTQLKDLSQARSGHACAFIKERASGMAGVMVAGGFPAGGAMWTTNVSRATTNHTEFYDINQGYWRRVGDLNMARRGVKMVFLQGRLYAMGGFNGTNYVSTVEVFDFATETWQYVESMFQPRAFHGVVEVPAQMFLNKKNLAIGQKITKNQSSPDQDDLKTVLLNQLSLLNKQNQKISQMFETLSKNSDIDGDLIPLDYDKRKAPPSTSVRNIQIAMDILSIPHLNEKEESIKMEMRVTHSWMDSRLNMDGIKNVKELEPSAINEFWTPDSYFSHAIKSKKVQVLGPAASLNVYRDGWVKYSQVQVTTLFCPMRFEYYPFDTQVCRIQLQSFGYNNSNNAYNWDQPPNLQQSNLDNHRVIMKHYKFLSSKDNMSFPGVGIDLAIQRKLSFHLTQTYIPSVIFIIVAWFSFFVPSDVIPGRMALCITTLLVFTTMFVSVRSLTPQVSYLKSIDIWVLVCLLFVFFTLAEYGLILHLTTRASWQKKIDIQIRAKEIWKTQLKKEENPIDNENYNKVIKELKTKMEAGENRLSRISLIDVLSTDWSYHPGPNSHPDDLQNRHGRNTRRIIINPKEAEVGLKKRERLAYKIEYCIKIIYPITFLVFNIIYWSFYINYYFTIPEVW